MSASAESVLQTPNDSIGSPLGFVSPYLLDILIVGIVAVLMFSDLGGGVTRSAAFIFASVLALWATVNAKTIRRYITDTPRSKLGSAAQGFVELQGRCEFYGNRETQGFMHGPPCVWHRYLKVGLRASPVQVGASELPFIIRDDSGVCIVNPKGAKLISSSKRSWWRDKKYYSSKFIRHGANMYIIGEMRSSGCAISSFNENAETAGLLGKWKKDQTWLIDEFDVDQNGELDAEEWQSAVKRARAISQNLFEAKSVDRVENSISKPASGLPLLISDRDPDVLANKFARLGYFNLVVGFYCLLAAFYSVV